MKNSNKIEENQKRKIGMVLTVDDDVGCAGFRVQCAFPIMESEAIAKCKNIKNISKKSEKIEAVGDNVTWCFQGPLYISLYRSAK